MKSATSLVWWRTSRAEPDNAPWGRAETGDVVWKQRTYAGSLILVDDALVVLSAIGGVVRVVEATPSGYRERARLEVLNRGAQTEAPPSFAAGMIFVRNDEEIVAIAVSPS